MGSTNSKSTYRNNCSNTGQLNTNNCILSLSSPNPLLGLCNYNSDEDDFRYGHHKPSACSKKKVLMLGLDGVGKTELFKRLIYHDKKRVKIDFLAQPTMGYNVETIKVRCHHLCHRQYHKITLWDCGGQSSVRSLWSYHYSNTSLLLWVINIHDRLRLDTNLRLLSQILRNPMLNRVPVLIVLYNSIVDRDTRNIYTETTNETALTNMEIAFRFLATLSTSRASTFKWQVINVTFTANDSQTDLKKVLQCFRELMDL